ncbi:MAG TPA: hypothetical protein VK563_13395 [Puia sp.]|nr:hypothetical protein [Puia sp.]
MKKLFLSALASLIIVSLFAQDSTYRPQTDPRNKKNAKRERINNLIRMEEEGDLIFNKHNIFGIKLATDGYGISFEKGKYKTPSRTLLFGFELNEKKSNKEHKISASDGIGYSSVVPYKLNNFYEFKLSIGQQHLIGGKGNKNGVAVTALYSGGLSLAMLKPYYVEVQDRNTQATSRMTFQQLVNDTSGSNLQVTGASGFTVGWGHLSVKPGANARAAMRFDYGRLNQTITAIEVGLTAEYYTGKIPIVLYVPEKQFFFNAYLSILFGSRK